MLDLEYSPIKGPEGNIEYLVHIKKTDDPIKEESVDIHSVVEASASETSFKVFTQKKSPFSVFFMRFFPLSQPCSSQRARQ